MRLEDRIAPATYTVTNNSNSGAGSLRQAVINANGSGGADTINFLVIPSPITLTTGEIAINEALTIKGPGADNLTVSGNNLSRIFNTTGAPAGAAISINGLTLTGGDEPAAGANGGAILAGNENVNLTDCVITGNLARNHGGAISSDGDLTLTNCVVDNNTVTIGTGEGGGIWHSTGKLLVDNSTISDNTAPSLGGGIFTNGDATVTYSTISNNDVTGIWGDGGGIWQSTGKLYVSYSTISGNTANYFGGGISTYKSQLISVFNSTVSGNTATNADGGGININTVDSAIFNNSTISGNTAGDDGGGIFGSGIGLFTVRNSTVAFNTAADVGGGIYVAGDTLDLVSSIVAKNNSAPLAARDISGSVNSTFSFIGSTYGATVNGTPLTGDPLLGSLDFNGGLTKTHALLAGSPCLNKGLDNPAPFDQRGYGFVRAYILADIGAYEDQHHFNVSTDDDSGQGSLRQAVINANDNPGDDTISWLFGFGGDTITLTTGEISISEAVAVNGPSADPVTINGNGASRMFKLTSAPSGTEISFSNLTISNGLDSSYGGAIRGDNQKLILNNCLFDGNATTANGGGAVAMISAGSVTASDCTFTNNTAAAFGGAIDVFGTGAKAVLTNCVISGNTGTNAGGIYARTYLFAQGCTFSGNKATAGSGGAIYMSGQGGTGDMIMRNCTISGNQSTANGGGVLLFNFPGTLSVQNSTIVNNAALFNNGGGICRVSGAGTISIESSVVSGNTSAGADDIFSGGTVNVTTSAIGTGDGFTKTDLGGNLPFQAHANLFLGSLVNNGGPSQTHMPGKGSPLIGKGSNPATLTSDQRGAGFVRISGGIEIGAVEIQHDFVVLNANESGTGSLRQAVLDANANPGGDTITFDPTYFSSAKTISLFDFIDGSTEIAISEGVTITGPGAKLATISGHNDARIFNTQSSPAGNNIVITGLTLTEGNSASSGGAILGGDEDIFLNDCVLTGNKTSANGGGAVAVVSGGTLTAMDCQFSSNVGAAFAGAIAVFGAGAKTTLQRCEITGNSAPYAGGIYARNYLSIEASTLSGNKATAGKGGAVYMSGYGGTGTMFVRNSTISGNSSTANGGGIVLVVFPGTLTVQNSTIVNNSATALFTNGGGICRFSGAGSISLESSVVSGNTCNSGPDIFSGGLVQMKTSAVESGSGFAKTDLGGNLPFQAHANLKLGPLADNGGPMQTHRPESGSPLINAGSNPLVLKTDQRGVSRVLGPAIDIGSVETVEPLIVTNNNDSGPGSLRQNINDANLDAGMNTITFDPAFFAAAKVITLATGELLITDSVTITGPGALLATVDGNNASRVFMLNGPGTLDVTISGLTVTKGFAVLGRGAGIFSLGENITVQDCVITGNSGGTGTGISVTSPGSLNLVNSQVTKNTSSNYGGGIHTFGGASATITASTISGNTAAFVGGALMLTGQFSMLDSAVFDNSSGAGGGGLWIQGLGPVTIVNSTISGNTAGADAGGIQLGSAVEIEFDGALTIRNSTITNNKANAGVGGGIGQFSGIGTISIESTIVAVNAASAGGPDISTPGTVNAKTSLIGTISGINTLSADAFTTANVGKAPLLGPLANNGGPTLTHALMPGSPAIDNGSNPGMLVSDQRGIGFARSIGFGPDIGAFEVQPPPPCVVGQTVIINGGDVQRSRVTSVKINFDQIVTLPISPADAFQLKRQSDNAIVALTANVTVDTATHVELTFAGAVSEFGSLEDGRYTLTIIASKVSGPGGYLDGDCNGVGGDDFVLASAGTSGVFRLFGDGDGNALVNSIDFALLRTVFGIAGPPFDFDNSGVVNSIDFAEFRKRFGLSI